MRSSSLHYLIRCILPTFLLLAPTLHAAESGKRPNFLFVYTDDQRWDAMSAVQKEQGERARFPWFQTPNMDRLAAEGVRFRNAFVTLSLCAPSRAAFLTGRYNHQNGVANNHTFFPTNNVTHASLMRASGYVTGYIGKWHMGGQRGQRPGFDYSASFIGQGRYENCPMEFNGVEKPTTGWVDDVSTDLAIQFMKDHRTQPFSLVVGFKACHGPCDPPERAKTRFEDQTARAVPNLASRAIFRSSDEVPAKKAAKNGGININLNYFRCISAADDNLGRLLTALDELGLANDTVVVFASDNGFYNGEHGLGDKRSAYDESLRIPMIVRYPKAFPKGKVFDDMVLNIDLAPTFLELAGLPVPAEMQGRSWAPLLTGKSSDWRKSFLAEYFYERGFTGTPTVIALRTDNAKLIKYPGHEEWTEVFDLTKDPYEIKNLASDPAAKALRAKLEAEYDRQAKATQFRIPADSDDPANDDTAAKKSAKKKKKQAEKNE